MKKLTLLFMMLVALIIVSCADTPPAPIGPFRGINLSGAESGSAYPGVEGQDYIWPTTGQVDYYTSKNMNTFRVNFMWERLQPTAKGELNAAHLAKLKTVVNYATGKGANVLLNPQNFARYYGKQVGSADVPNDVFADFWRRLALEFKNNPKVLFGLVNEPKEMSTAQWRLAAQAAINSIRAAGADNIITVPGNGWTGMHSWQDSWYDTASPAQSNAQEMIKITDPKNNFVFEVHQYFDSDFGGGYSNGNCVSATVGVDKAKPFVAWLRANNKKAIIAEFGAPNNTLCKSTVDNFLKYVKDNSDVLVGWMWWNAIRDNFWGNPYILDLTPKNGADDPRMSWLTPYLLNGSSSNDAGTSPVDTGAPSPSFPTNPMTVTKNTVFTTTSPVGTGTQTNWAYVPNSYDSTHKTPTQLFVWLHGCGGQSEFDAHMVSFMPNQNWISLAPGGREKACWSGIGTDGSKILAAIADIKTRFNIDPYRIVLGGYSSGGDIGYPLLFQNANMFAGGIFENTGPSTAAMTDSNSATWKVNIFHLAHTGDTTYPIATIRTKMTTLKNNGFPVTLVEKPGGHYDNDNGTTGTEYDLRTFALPHLNDGWLAPGAPTPPVDAGQPPVDSGTPPVDSGTPPPVDAGTPDSGTPDAGTPPDLKPVVRITYNWGSGYCEEVDLANKTAGTLTWAQISLNLRGGTIRDQDKKGPPWDTWNGTFSARTGVITVKPASWNKTVAPGKKVTIGFCADFGPQKWTGTIVQGSLK